METPINKYKGITHSVAHYLIAVDVITSKKGYCRAADIARMLGVSRNAVSLKLQSLRGSDWLYVDEYKNVKLTKSGAEKTAFIVSMRRTVKHLLVDLLGVDEGVANQDACLVEHLLSRQTGLQLLNMFQFINQGSPSAQKFLTDFKKFALNHSCDGDVDCGICYNQCMMNSNADDHDMEHMPAAESRVG